MAVRTSLMDFQVPRIAKEEVGESRGVFVIEPLDRGFGYTFGNSLRRVLLSSLEGAAVTSVKIEGVAHVFTTLPGVREDVIDIILNLKNLTCRLHGESPEIEVRLEKKGPGSVTAGGADVTTARAAPDVSGFPGPPAFPPFEGPEARPGSGSRQVFRGDVAGDEPSPADPSRNPALALGGIGSTPPGSAASAGPGVDTGCRAARGTTRSTAAAVCPRAAHGVTRRRLRPASVCVRGSWSPS